MNRFPLADWIDDHPDCRHDLATSGMRGSVPPIPGPFRNVEAGVLEELRAELADHLSVAAERVLLSHGASEANAWVLGHLARELGRGGRAPRLRVRFPEYPPLFDGGQAHGFILASGRGAADVAVVSRPRNPEGDLWPEEVISHFARGARHLLVDETFREFSGARTLAVAGEPRLWTTGSFTKFYGADAARVGYVVAPPDVPERFVRYVGLVSDEVAPGSAAIALALLRGFPAVRRAVRSVVERNLEAFRAAFPDRPAPVAPLFFDRPTGEPGRALAERCLAASVLVAPGEFFGSPAGVRVCLTRRAFPVGLRAYLRVREPPENRASPRSPRVDPLDRSSRHAPEGALRRGGRRVGAG